MNQEIAYSREPYHLLVWETPSSNTWTYKIMDGSEIVRTNYRFANKARAIKSGIKRIKFFASRLEKIKKFGRKSSKFVSASLMAQRYMSNKQ